MRELIGLHECRIPFQNFLKCIDAFGMRRGLTEYQDPLLVCTQYTGSQLSWVDENLKQKTPAHRLMFVPRILLIKHWATENRCNFCKILTFLFLLSGRMTSIDLYFKSRVLWKIYQHTVVRPSALTSAHLSLLKLFLVNRGRHILSSLSS